MEINMGNLRITSAKIMNVSFIIALITTISQIATNLFYEKRFSTETVVMSAFITSLCYYFSRKKT